MRGTYLSAICYSFRIRVGTMMCFYAQRKECDGEGKHQCPWCKNWYCDTCHEMFLNVAEMAGELATLPKPICPQCHYTTFWVPKLEADRYYAEW